MKTQYQTQSRFLIALLIMLVISSCSQESKDTADLVIINSKIHTVDEANRQFEAIAVRDGKIIAVGTTEEIQSYTGSATTLINAEGNLVLPGFIDSHMHAFWGGQRLIEINLRNVESVEELQQRLSNWINEKQIPEGEPVWGIGPFPNPNLFGGVGWPTKEILDEVSPMHPVILSRGGGHALWVNSLALSKAGITKDTAVPEGGEVVIDERSGELTGILKEAAQNLITDNIEHKIDQKAVFEKAMANAIEFGLTGITPITTDLAGLEAIRALQQEGKLTTRVNVGFSTNQLDTLISLGMKTGDGDDMVRIGPLKIFMDGSLGALSAFMYEEFTDNPGNIGLAQYTEEGINTLVEKAHNNNFQVAIHAIGDKGVTWVLNAIERAQKNFGDKGLRHRVEHNTVNIDEDTNRFNELSVIASMQPHITGSQAYRERRLGTERANHVDMWRSLLNNEAMIAWGTDWPVSSLNPMDVLDDVVTRFPEQRLTMQESIRNYTFGSAFAAHDEDNRGSLEVGKLADIVILSRDIFTIPPEEIAATEVLYTILGGKVVYQRQ